jgi:hypothetical protein
MRSLLLCLLAMVVSVSSAQLDLSAETLPQVLPIEKAPKDLIPVSFETGSGWNGIYNQAILAASSTQDASQKYMAQMLIVHWVSNDELKGNGTFIRCYKFFPNTGQKTLSLRLTYVRRDVVTSITPMPDYSIEEIQKNIGRGIIAQPELTVHISNLKQIATATMIYLSDADDIFPYVQSTRSLWNALGPYMRNAEMTKTKNPNGGQILFNMSLAGVSLSDVNEPAKVPMFFDSVAWPDGRYCVAFADTLVKWVNQEQWEALKPLLKLKLKRNGKPIAEPPPTK